MTLFGPDLLGPDLLGPDLLGPDLFGSHRLHRSRYCATTQCYPRPEEQRATGPPHPLWISWGDDCG